MVFLLIKGFKVDQVFITNWLSKNLVSEPKGDEDVFKYLHDRYGFMKEKAMKQYRGSKDATENFEYRLNHLIGPTRIGERILSLQQNAKPVDEALSHVLEADVFNTSVIDEIDLYPKPKTSKQTKTDKEIKLNEQ